MKLHGGTICMQVVPSDEICTAQSFLVFLLQSFSKTLRLKQPIIRAM